jgi:hypothetical protein
MSKRLDSRMAKPQLTSKNIDIQSEDVLPPADPLDVPDLKAEQIIQDVPQLKWYSYVWDTFGELYCLSPSREYHFRKPKISSAHSLCFQ